MLRWFKSKRVKALEELVGLYKKNISELQVRPEYVSVRVPGPDDKTAYWQKLSEFDTNEFFQWHFTRMREGITKAFVIQGKEHSEYFRGKLAAIDDILLDGKNARRKLEADFVRSDNVRMDEEEERTSEI
jgi:hypothetical protein